MNLPIAETEELEELRVSPSLIVPLAALKFHSKLEKERKEAKLRLLLVAMTDQHKVYSQMMKTLVTYFLLWLCIIKPNCCGISFVRQD